MFDEIARCPAIEDCCVLEHGKFDKTFALSARDVLRDMTWVMRGKLQQTGIVFNR